MANVKSLLDLPEAVQTAIDDPDNGFTATHGVTLRQMANNYGLNARKMGRWVKDVVAQELSVSQLKRAMNAEYRREPSALPESIFRASATDRAAGVFRLQPVSIRVADLSDEDRAALREELGELLAALG